MTYSVLEDCKGVLMLTGQMQGRRTKGSKFDGYWMPNQSHYANIEVRKKDLHGRYQINRRVWNGSQVRQIKKYYSI